MGERNQEIMKERREKIGCDLKNCTLFFCLLYFSGEWCQVVKCCRGEKEGRQVKEKGNYRTNTCPVRSIIHQKMLMVYLKKVYDGL